VGPMAGLDGCGKSRPTGILSPDRPARSESLYRLSYRGPQEQANIRIISNLNLKNENVRGWTGFFSLKVESSGGM